jgi:hypothetical protein
MAVLLERNDTGVVTGVPLLFWGVAVKVWDVLPTSSETSVAGERTILAGTGNGVFRVGLLLLQLVRAASKPHVMHMNTKPAEPSDLPMHPPRPVDPRGELCGHFWKAPSVEARIFFSKLGRFATSEPAGEIPNEVKDLCKADLPTPNSVDFQMPHGQFSGNPQLSM